LKRRNDESDELSSNSLIPDGGKCKQRNGTGKNEVLQCCSIQCIAIKNLSYVFILLNYHSMLEKNKILFSVLRRAVFKYLLTLEIDLHFE
jgi:hypothetical protein